MKLLQLKDKPCVISATAISMRLSKPFDPAEQIVIHLEAGFN
jgi:hypothetical protein